MSTPEADVSPARALAKAPTGIAGLDEITYGGLPQGRTTLICGGPGCGKTLLGIQFLVRGALDHGEPAVMMAFEESPAALAINASSFGWDLEDLIARDLLVIDSVRLQAAAGQCPRARLGRGGRGQATRVAPARVSAARSSRKPDGRARGRRERARCRTWHRGPKKQEQAAGDEAALVTARSGDGQDSVALESGT